MSGFMVGDVVEATESGRGVAGSNVGRRTIITATGGTYGGEHDAVKTRDFYNPGDYGDWISSRSFKLIKGVKRTVLKPGDKVAVIDCPTLRLWNHWKNAVGRIYTLNTGQVKRLNSNTPTPLGGNEEMINYTIEMLEKI